MDEDQDRDQQLDSQRIQPEPRRFIYRAVEPEATQSHPQRRSTDIPRAFQGVAGEICPKTQYVKMRVYLKLN
jgi:hypothetical protein